MTIRFKVPIVLIPLLWVSCVQSAAADWQLICVTSTSYSLIWDPYYDTWITLPSVVVVCGYIWVESSEEETNLTQPRVETEEERNQRVLNEMDACVVRRVRSFLRECEASNDAYEEDESCEAQPEDLNMLHRYRTYLTKNQPMETAELDGKFGQNTNRGEKIEIDVNEHLNTFPNSPSAQGRALADTVIHERLHSYPRWCSSSLSVEECRPIEEHAVDLHAGLIRRTLKEFSGSFSLCVDWDFKEVDE